MAASAGITSAERLATTLTGAMPAGQCIGTVEGRLNRPLVLDDQPIADSERAFLVELELLDSV
jgi:hypothetical protein